LDGSLGSRQRNDQRNDQGKEKSRRTGQPIKERNMPIGEVYASSFLQPNRDGSMWQAWAFPNSKRLVNGWHWKSAFLQIMS
jgi:hypothetical protein